MRSRSKRTLSSGSKLACVSASGMPTALATCRAHQRAALVALTTRRAVPIRIWQMDKLRMIGDGGTVLAGWCVDFGVLEGARRMRLPTDSAGSFPEF